jgi:hypothetical protein
MKYFILTAIILGIFSCQNKKSEKVHYPSQTYEYSKADVSQLPVHQTVYVPVYSHIYDKDGTTIINLTATLSIRSTDFTDSIYVTKADYYGSDGKLIKKYLDSTLLVKPMNSVEFIVEHSETAGGAGANFMVEWHAKNAVTPVIQAVMLSTLYSAGISFVVNGVPVKN